MTAEQFRYVCAWCKKFMGGDPDSEMVSHGICEDCAEIVAAEKKP